jgi:lipoprotein-anchoring transpeptidase ErfK/SrfK
LSEPVEEGLARERRPGVVWFAADRLRMTVALGVLAAALLPADFAKAQLFQGGLFGSPYGYGYQRGPAPPAAPYYRAPKRKKVEAATSKKEATAKPPQGPLLIAVSLNSQRVTVYSNGVPIAHSPVSTGTPSNPTPTGIFSIIQKNRFHRSNLYSNAPMPFMQRITWSGVALHQGVLPGYPASHGCIRLPLSFASYLWGTTRMGARVIITREEATPSEIAHATLFTPKPKVEEEPLGPAAQVEAVRPLKIAESDNPDRASDALRPTEAAMKPTGPATGLKGSFDSHVVELGFGSRTEMSGRAEAAGTPPKRTSAAGEVSDIVDAQAPSPTAADAAPAGAAAGSSGKGARASAERKETPRMSEPVSVFVSRKAGRLYVRQGFEPLFDAPVTIKDPDAPIGTHLYTALDFNENRSAMKWSAVTLPTRSQSAEAERRKGETKEPRNAREEHEAKKASYAKPSAAAALARIEMPKDAVERISELMSPGSSLIISDYPISGETGKYTDFIVLTR